VATICPGALHVRTEPHRPRGETTQAIERGHVPTRDRLRNSRGLKRTDRDGPAAPRGLRGHMHLRRGGTPGAGHLVPGPVPHARVRQAVAAIHAVSAGPEISPADAYMPILRRKRTSSLLAQHSMTFQTALNPSRRYLGHGAGLWLEYVSQQPGSWWPSPAPGSRVL
jgi:hypothetical protein